MDDKRGAVAIDRRYAMATLTISNPSVLVGMMDLDMTIELVEP
jgi:hypothetical protein